ncbi:MAG: hypothetical protein AAFY08_12565 [Planctomycetota bacterium]
MDRFEDYKLTAGKNAVYVRREFKNDPDKLREKLRQHLHEACCTKYSPPGFVCLFCLSLLLGGAVILWWGWQFAGPMNQFFTAMSIGSGLVVVPGIVLMFCLEHGIYRARLSSDQRLEVLDHVVQRVEIDRIIKAEIRDQIKAKFA